MASVARTASFIAVKSERLDLCTDRKIRSDLNVVLARRRAARHAAWRHRSELAPSGGLETDDAVAAVLGQVEGAGPGVDGAEPVAPARSGT